MTFCGLNCCSSIVFTACFSRFTIKSLQLKHIVCLNGSKFQLSPGFKLFDSLEQYTFCFAAHISLMLVRRKSEDFIYCHGREDCWDDNDNKSYLCPKDTITALSSFWGNDTWTLLSLFHQGSSRASSGRVCGLEQDISVWTDKEPALSQKSGSRVALLLYWARKI